MWLRNLFVRRWTKGPEQVIFITGCDSGLGYSLAKKCFDEGLSIVAGCYRIDSDGARNLKRLEGPRALVLPLDVTLNESVREAAQRLDEFLVAKKLQAVVNNAAVLVFGEFEWQTEQQIFEQVSVNQLGYFRVARALLPTLRQHKGRLINVTSHCALAGLPQFSVYGATKAASLAWSDALRIEQAKYGVKVISFIPGSFFLSSRIMHRQGDFAKEMLSEMSPEHRKFHEKYFHTVQNHILQLPTQTSVEPLNDEELYQKLLHAILSPNPRVLYKKEPARYQIYHLLFKLAPPKLRDNLILKFMILPKYSNN